MCMLLSSCATVCHGVGNSLWRRVSDDRQSGASHKLIFQQSMKRASFSHGA